MKLNYKDGVWSALLLIAVGFILYLTQCQADKPCPEPTIERITIQLPPDTVTITEQAKPIIKEIEIPVTDRSAIDSLIALYDSKVQYYQRQADDLRVKAERQAAALEAIKHRMRVYQVQDTINTPSYSLTYFIEAEGPLRSFNHQLTQYNTPENAPEEPATIYTPSLNALSAHVGGQYSNQALRPVIGLQYRRRWWTVGVDYLPPVGNLQWGVQPKLGASLQW
jgi:hypothetical protein